MRSGSNRLHGATCVALAFESARWSVRASCPAAWTPSVPEKRPSTCCSDCRVPASVPAEELAALAFACSTAPSVPGESLRNPPAWLVAPYCWASAPDVAACFVTADWPAAWTALPQPEPLPPQQDASVRWSTPPGCCCHVPCVVWAVLPASDCAAFAFVCFTLPPE